MPEWCFCLLCQQRAATAHRRRRCAALLVVLVCRLGAVTITRGADGACITDIPEPHHDKRAAAETAHLLATTAADIPFI
ncbi:MAG TPA: hypothetical protein VGD71_42245 [Kribbella sp.]